MAEAPRPAGGVPHVESSPAARPGPGRGVAEDVGWSRPPPGSRPPPRTGPPGRGWLVVAGVLGVLLVAVAVWAGRGPAGPTGSAQPPPGAGDGGTAVAAPADRTDVAGGLVEGGEPAPVWVDPVLEELRASERYLAFAEHQRARQSPSPIPGEVPGSEAWALFAKAGYANAEALWDEVVAPIRDDALLAGDPFTEPIWGEHYGTDAWIPELMTRDTAEGRHDIYRFVARMSAPAGGEPAERHYAVHVVADASGRGRVVARMTPFDMQQADAASFTEGGELARERVWSWVQERSGSGA